MMAYPGNSSRFYSGNITFDIESIKLMSADSVKLHGLTTDNNLNFYKYIQEIRQLALRQLLEREKICYVNPEILE